jgi:hypothetical protein
MNYSANKMAAKHCLSAQCIVVDIVPLSAYDCLLYASWLNTDFKNNIFEYCSIKEFVK